MDWSEIMLKEQMSFSGNLGMKFNRIDKDCVELELEIEEKHLNYVGIVHGGVLSSLMDQSMGTLVGAIKGRLGVTTHLNVNFLHAAKAGAIKTYAYPVHETFRSMTCRAEVRDSNDELCCMATGTFRLPRE